MVYFEQARPRRTEVDPGGKSPADVAKFRPMLLSRDPREHRHEHVIDNAQTFVRWGVEAEHACLGTGCSHSSSPTSTCRK